jgi:hypothetical protein
MPAASRREPKSEAVLVDTGVLVALYAVGDPLHAAARHWMSPCRGALHTVGCVLAETAWQLPARDRRLVADLARTGVVSACTPPRTPQALLAWPGCSSGTPSLIPTGRISNSAGWPK